MIHINLLPEEYRRKQRTPVKLMLAVAGAVAVNASLAAWWGWTAFGIAAEVKSEYSVLQTEMDGLEPQVAYHKALEAESGVYKHREDTLAGITAKRISWTKKVDELIDVVNRGGDGQRHLIWLDDLNADAGGRQALQGCRQPEGERALGLRQVRAGRELPRGRRELAVHQRLPPAGAAGGL